jgi:hypothetical protein
MRGNIGWIDVWSCAPATLGGRGACAYFLLGIVSCVMTYPQGRIADIYLLMQLPPGEVQFLA